MNFRVRSVIAWLSAYRKKGNVRNGSQSPYTTFESSDSVDSMPLLLLLHLLSHSVNNAHHVLQSEGLAKNNSFMHLCKKFKIILPLYCLRTSS